jgi:hypothetical protein
MLLCGVQAVQRDPAPPAHLESSEGEDDMDVEELTVQDSIPLFTMLYSRPVRKVAHVQKLLQCHRGIRPSSG